MRSILTVLFLFFFFGLKAQQPMSYYYTAASERFLSDGEMDSIFNKTSQEIFEENAITGHVYEKKYEKVKPILVGFSRTNILQGFKSVERANNVSLKAAKGSPKFIVIKDAYSAELRNAIRKTFENKVLQMYLSSNGSDKITSFKSIVRVLPNGKLRVQEIIRVYNGDGTSTGIYGNEEEEEPAINNEIKRGIVRAFPLAYINEHKLFQNTTFEVKQVLRDGKKEEYHTESKNNGILLYTGNKYIFLPKGNYTYGITYETDHQLKLLKDYDELYWNVTGNSWSFRIDSASCTVILPPGYPPLSSKCYTGQQGESKEECTMSRQVIDDTTYVTFKTIRALHPNHGLTIATSWKKGFLQQPSFTQTAWYYFWNNKAVFFLPLVALFSLVSCFIFWLKYGVDKKRGSIYPQYTPPAGYSPAALGYIYRQKFNRILTAATIVDAAVRNVIKIEVEREGWLIKHNEYNIRRPDKPKKVPASNYEDFENDIEKLIGTAIEKGKYNSGLGKLNTALEAWCKSKYKANDGVIKNAGLFALNRSYTTIPILLLIVGTIWGFFGGVVPALNFKNYWQAEVFVGAFVLNIIILVIFRRLLPSYSQRGREVMDQVEGFRMFLSTADAQRFDAMAPPEKTLELYEKYLPFAIALDCEIAWGDQFKEVIDTASINNVAGGAGSYSSSFSRDSHNFSSSFASSFSGAISSATTPPSSSSSGGGSSFGGGSSGGGGGGGGGGGW